MFKKNDEFIQNLNKVSSEISSLYKGYISTTNDKFEFIDFKVVDNELNLITNSINTKIHKISDESDFLVLTKTNEYVVVIQYDNNNNEMTLYDQLGEKITTINNVNSPHKLYDIYDSILNEYNIHINDINNKLVFSLKLDYDNSLINIYDENNNGLLNNSSQFLFHIIKQHDSIINDYIPYHSRVYLLDENDNFSNNKITINSINSQRELLIKNTEINIGSFFSSKFGFYFSDKLDLLFICYLNKNNELEVSNYSNRETQVIKFNDENFNFNRNDIKLENIDLLVDLHSIYIFIKINDYLSKRVLLKTLNTSNYKLPDYTILQEVNNITKELRAGIINKLDINGNNINANIFNNTLQINSNPKIELLNDVQINNVNDDILIKNNNKWESKNSVIHIDESIKKIIDSDINLTILKENQKNTICLNKDININSMKTNNVFIVPLIIKPENNDKIDLNNKYSFVILDPPNNRTGIVINLPSVNVQDGQKFELISRRNITNIQLNPVSIISNQVLNLTPGSKITFIYSLQENMWYTIR